MATKTAILSIDIVSDVSKAEKGFTSAASAADKMGAAVEDASRRADDGVDRMNSAGEAADDLASKSSQATGGLGALASGFELVGAEKYAIGLQSAAMATDFFSGVGDIANLVLESQAVQTIKNTALKVKDAVVTRASAVATGIMTGAQAALNAVMAANPILLVVAALVLLTAGVILAYKKSETFRNVVQRVGKAVVGVWDSIVDAVDRLVGWVKDKLPDAIRKGKDIAVRVIKLYTLPIRTVIDVIQALIGWVKDKLPDAIRKGKDLAVGYIKLYTLPIRTVIDVVQSLIGWVRDKAPEAFAWLRDRVTSVVSSVTDRVGRIIDKVQDLVSLVRDKAGSVFGGLRDKAVDAFDAITAPVQDLIDLVQDLIGWVDDLIDKIGDIDFPDLPDVPGIPGFLVPGSTGGFDRAASGTTMVTINIDGAIDPYSTAKQVKELLDRADTWQGRIVVTP